MARWKLATSHYLNTVRPAKWRYQETDRSSGDNLEQEYIVPRMLDVQDPKCWTNRWGNQDNREGEIIVCQPGKGEKGDIEFLGDPTPDMLPQDEEAEAISASFADHWAYKPDTMEPPISQSILSPAPVEIPGMSELVAAMTMTIQQNQEILKTLAVGRGEFGLKV